MSDISPRRLAGAIVLAASLCVPEASHAANPAQAAATASELKAAFLYNFAKFTEWPPDAVPAGHGLTLCVAGDRAVAAALERIVRGRTVDGREIGTAAVSLERNLTSCHVLYVSSADAGGATLVFDALKTAPVLTVSDSDTFLKRGGIVQLILDNDRMRFVINVAAARRARLTLSSNLLNLATIVKDGSDVDH